MSRYVQLPSGQYFAMGDVTAASLTREGDGPVHLLWPRRKLFGNRRLSASRNRAALDDCRCSVRIVRFLIWATRHAHQAGE